MSEIATPFGQGRPGADFARDPYPILAGLSGKAPRHYSQERDAWFISAPSDITALLRDDRLTITHSSSFADQSPDFRTAVARRLRNWFASSEGALSQTVSAVVERCVSALAGRTKADLVKSVAHFVPAGVMGELLGIPPADLPPLQRAAEEVLQSYDLDWSGRPPARIATANVLRAYFHNHWRAAPDTPLLRLLRDAQTDRDLPHASVTDACTKLFTAGTTTTAGCMANILARLVDDVDDREGSLGSVSVEELLRRDLPVLAIKRVARDAVQLGDAVLRPGQKVYLLIASASRAPVLPDERPPPNLTFGLGRHHCLGAALARLEIAALLDRLLPLAPRLRLASPVAWREAWLIHEARSIHVTIDRTENGD